jgi:hypothetical protein
MDLQAQTTPNYQATTKSTTKVGHTIEELNGFYTEGDGADRATFAEMRSKPPPCRGRALPEKRFQLLSAHSGREGALGQQKLGSPKITSEKMPDYSNNIMCRTPGRGLFAEKRKKSSTTKK